MRVQMLLFIAITFLSICEARTLVNSWNFHVVSYFREGWRSTYAYLRRSVQWLYISDNSVLRQYRGGPLTGYRNRRRKFRSWMLDCLERNVIPQWIPRYRPTKKIINIATTKPLFFSNSVKKQHTLCLSCPRCTWLFIQNLIWNKSSGVFAHMFSRLSKLWENTPSTGAEASCPIKCCARCERKEREKEETMVGFTNSRIG